MTLPEASIGSMTAGRVTDQLDRAAIDGLINDYFHALDTRDGALLASAFLEDATYVVRLADGSVYEMGNRDAIVAGCTFVHSLVSNHHGTCSRRLTVESDTAHADIRGHDVLAEVREGESRLIGQGLRYRIDFLRRAEGWRIAASDLRISWQDMTANPRILPEPFWPGKLQ